MGRGHGNMGDGGGVFERQDHARRLAKVCWGRPSWDAPLTAATCGQEPLLVIPELFGQLGMVWGADDDIYLAGEVGVLFAMVIQPGLCHCCN